MTETSTWFRPCMTARFAAEQEVLLSDELAADWNTRRVGGFPAGRIVSVIFEGYLGYCGTCEHEGKDSTADCPGPWYNVDFGEFGTQLYADHELQAAIEPPLHPDEQLELFDVFATLLPPAV